MVYASRTQRVIFTGEVDFAEGEHIGVELDDPVGNCNGTVDGKEYFVCDKKVKFTVRRGPTRC